MKFFHKISFLVFGVLTLISLSSIFPGEIKAMECGGPYPPKPAKVWAKSGPGGGQVTLYWDEVAYADRYAVAYGTSSGNYIYGATNIGGKGSHSYTVSGLSGGTKYYFRLAAARDCTSSPFSDEISAWAAGGSMQTATSYSQTSAGSSQTWAQPAATQSNMSAWSGPGIGQVTLKWWHKEDVDNYHLVYGTQKGNYQYGALNIGKITQFTVSLLTPGRGYYFALVPVKGNRALYTGEAVWAYAKQPIVEVIETKSENVTEPVSELPQAQKAEVEEVADEGEVEDLDEAGDVDMDDEAEDEQYEQENSNVQGMSDEADYEPEDENYAAENEALDETQAGSLEENFGPPFAADDDSDPRIGSPEEDSAPPLY